MMMMTTNKRKDLSTATTTSSSCCIHILWWMTRYLVVIVVVTGWCWYTSIDGSVVEVRSFSLGQQQRQHHHSRHRRSCCFARDRRQSHNNHHNSPYHDDGRRRRPSSSTAATITTTRPSSSSRYWYPSQLFPAANNNNNNHTNSLTTTTTTDDPRETWQMGMEQRSIMYLVQRIRPRLVTPTVEMVVVNDDSEDHHHESGGSFTMSSNHAQLQNLVRGRFMDLTGTRRGEQILEQLLLTTTTLDDDPDTTTTTKRMDDDDDDDAFIIRGAVMVLQSICVLGTQVGVKGPPEQLRRMVEHLSDSVGTSHDDDDARDREHWTNDSVRRLKYRLDRTPGIQLLAALQRKQTPQGAFDLLRALGVWDRHEDLALLRSGFPIRFTNREELVARAVWDRYHNGTSRTTTNDAMTVTPDPDAMLGIRQDLRHLKVYTIDRADAAEIDDGISIETITNGRSRIWVHIADAEHYAPPDSDLFEIARRRITSLYLPSGSIAMFPNTIGTDLMSLKVNEDVPALSLGVELNDDGSLNESTIIVTPSLIKVSYRLTYDEVDEMLEEGIGYSEEWEIGALLMAAQKRRAFRIRNGSSEGMIPNPVPSSSVSIYSDRNAPDSIGISISIQVSHNAAMNKTAAAEHNSNNVVYEDPASSAYLLVTEAMIMAGEAIGAWKRVRDTSDNTDDFKNALQLPFRTQSPPGTFCSCDDRN